MGKAHYMVKDLTEVRSPQRKLMPDNAGSDQHEQTSLWGIAVTARNKKQHRFRNLYRLLTPRFLHMAWNQLNLKTAIADDDITVEIYRQNLYLNLADLGELLKTKRYKTKLIKRVYIPKENGKQRPLGIPALEDKIVQKAVALVLESIFEQDFLDCSYGYRPSRGAVDAAADLSYQLQFGIYTYIVEADIKGFFDHIDHDKLLMFLSKRIDDKAFLHLIRKWLKAGILEPGNFIIHPDTGTPQGGIVSPVLANVYLHYVLDKWFKETVEPRMDGDVTLCRYADDWVCAFQYRNDADRFYRTLPKRLKRFNLEVEPSKTRIIKFNRFHPNRRKGHAFVFLGFEYSWIRDCNKLPRVHRRTAPKRLQAGLRRMKVWIKRFRHLPRRQFFDSLNRKLRGHYNYYYARGNSESVWAFYNVVIGMVFKWLNRRSHKVSYTWERFSKLLNFMRVAMPKVLYRRRLRQEQFSWC
jgi:RNA-directed DNA polymerase